MTTMLVMLLGTVAAAFAQTNPATARRSKRYFGSCILTDR